MKEGETGEFLKTMKRYAISRGGDPDLIEEFPAFAWEMIEVRKWKSSWKQIYDTFLRERLGEQGSAKNKVEKEIRHRQTKSYPDSDGDFIEERVAALTPAQVQFQDLSERDQMISVLLESGYSLSAIARSFGPPIVEAYRDRMNLLIPNKRYAALLKVRYRERRSAANRRDYTPEIFAYLSGAS